MLETYGHRIEVNDLVVGEPIKIKATYIRVFGPPTCEILVSIDDEDDDGYGWTDQDLPNRKWLCLYTYEGEFDPVLKPRKLVIGLVDFSDHQQPRVVKRKIVDVRRRTP